VGRSGKTRFNRVLGKTLVGLEKKTGALVLKEDGMGVRRRRFWQRSVKG